MPPEDGFDGRDNAFGHPHEDVVERFERLGIPLLLTHQRGGVTIETDGHEWEVSTTLEAPEHGAEPPEHHEASATGPSPGESPPPPPPHAP